MPMSMTHFRRKIKADFDHALIDELALPRTARRCLAEGQLSWLTRSWRPLFMVLLMVCWSCAASSCR